MGDHLEEIDSKLDKHAEALEQMQVKVDLTMDAMSKSKEEQGGGVRMAQESGLPPLHVPRREERSIIGMPEGMPYGMPIKIPPPPLGSRPPSSSSPRVRIKWTSLPDLAT
ncbi:uncharacterized protein LOC112270991 [Brachypodium distachyon]|uniref:uncharacterized protein LOC112270991 n=1 Tax=Brachypodium distachyon TaxID=15368 RepID=UPI000D0E2B02|nr:uncharacterized protein LOC112270991 [Brachypodium distachyon]|eukprot:XP_024315563.1 uncharacterized protein LOC112270991 [Brachypodium distachyon]